MTEHDDLEGRLQEFFAARLPVGWFTGAPRITADREEILVVGTLPAPEAETESSVERGLAAQAAAREYREETRDARIRIAAEAEHLFGRKVAWGVESGGETYLFTHLAVPVMTRLRQPERRVLDTLVDAGVARSRADALAWCVRLVGRNTDEWLGELRSALKAVEDVRARGPKTA
jgi:hypothetical protein